MTYISAEQEITEEDIWSSECISSSESVPSF